MRFTDIDIIEEDEITHKERVKKRGRGRPPGRSFKKRMASRHLVAKRPRVRIWLDTEKE